MNTRNFEKTYTKKKRNFEEYEQQEKRGDKRNKPTRYKREENF